LKVFTAIIVLRARSVALASVILVERATTKLLAKCVFVEPITATTLVGVALAANLSVV
jgi:hypothetical protein